MSSSIKITASMYDAIYARKTKDTLLDLLDREAIKDDEIASLKCTGFLAKGDLERYKVILEQYIPEHLANNEQRTLLDLGCGFGGLGRWLAKKLNLNLIGIDFSQVAIEKACDALGELDKNKIRFKVADFSATNLVSESLSAAISIDAVYLAANPLTALMEIHRILLPGSPFIFTIYVESLEKGSEDLEVIQPNWCKLLAESGFTLIKYKDVTVRWRKQMRQKHERRWIERQQIRNELGRLGEAELSVSAAMLGIQGCQSFLESVFRFEVVAIRI
jgi:ubiquinone/menaquinone biosynthesis C-methylase UbiE